jgi:hypothetical protein
MTNYREAAAPDAVLGTRVMQFFHLRPPADLERSSRPGACDGASGKIHLGTGVSRSSGQEGVIET